MAATQSVAERWWLRWHGRRRGCRNVTNTSVFQKALCEPGGSFAAHMTHGSTADAAATVVSAGLLENYEECNSLHFSDVPLDAQRFNERSPEANGMALIAPNGGLVQGKQRKKHHTGCICPNCNRIRQRVRSGSLAVRLLSEEEEHEVVLFDRSMQETLEQLEYRRRKNIGRRRTGQLPWNTGATRSEETKRRIRENTAKAMRQREMREHLRQARLQQPDATEESRRRASEALRAHHRRRRTRMFIERLQSAVALAQTQYTLPAPVPRPKETGAGQREKRKTKAHASQKKSAEHRNKISNAMKARWRDPEFRERTVSRVREEAQRRVRRLKAEELAPKLTEEQVQERWRLVHQGYEILRRAQEAAKAIHQRAAQGENISQDELQRYDDAVERARSSVQYLEENVTWIERARHADIHGALDDFEREQDAKNVKHNSATSAHASSGVEHEHEERVVGAA